jgi:hypothetical protein
MTIMAGIHGITLIPVLVGPVDGVGIAGDGGLQCFGHIMDGGILSMDGIHHTIALGAGVGILTIIEAGISRIMEAYGAI